MMPNHDGGFGEAREVSTPTSNPVTINRALNVTLMGLFFIAIVSHVVCLTVMAMKHKELVDKFAGDDPDIKKGCILFIDYDGGENPRVKWVNNRCDMVIYGSGALGGCALLMIVILIIRSLLFTKYLVV